MKVILLENVKGLGSKGDLIEVKDGFGKNFLIPKGLAKVATPQALKERDILLEKRRKEIEKLKEIAKEIVEKLKDKNFLFKRKPTPSGDTTFGSVSVDDLERILKEEFPQLESVEFQIKLEKPIKKFGDFKVKVIFLKEIEGIIKGQILKEDEES